ADREFHALPRADDGLRIEISVTHRVLVPRARRRRGTGALRANLGVLVRSVREQRASRAVPDIAALLDVDETRELKLLIANRRVRVAGPARVWIRDDALCVVDARHARVAAFVVAAVAQIERSLWRAGANLRQVDAGNGIVRADAAPHPSKATNDAERESLLGNGFEQ